MICPQKNTSTTETEETENQVCCHILPLLVCLFSLSGRWSPEIPDIGRLSRVLCISGDYAIAIGHSAHISSIQINKRR